MTTWKTRKAIAYAWLLRAHPGPLFDAAQANRILDRHEDLIKSELRRIKSLKAVAVERVTETVED